MLSPDRVELPIHLLKQDSDAFPDSPENVHFSNSSFDNSPVRVPLKITPVINQETSKKLIRNISDFNKIQISVYEASPSNLNIEKQEQAVNHHSIIMV